MSSHRLNWARTRAVRQLPALAKDLFGGTPKSHTRDGCAPHNAAALATQAFLFIARERRAVCAVRSAKRQRRALETPGSIRVPRVVFGVPAEHGFSGRTHRVALKCSSNRRLSSTRRGFWLKISSAGRRRVTPRDGCAPQNECSPKRKRRAAFADFAHSILAFAGASKITSADLWRHDRH